MTYTELIDHLSDKLGLAKTETRELTQQAVSELTDQLEKGNGFSIPRLGTFKITVRKSGKRYSPWHGRKVVVPHRRVVSFSPAKRLRERVNEQRSGP